jgi:FlgN protein
MIMTNGLLELAAILGEEVSVARELLDNLSAQREAILGWRIFELIERVENREILCSNLAILERRRKQIVGGLTGAEAEEATLTKILANQPDSKGTGELARMQKDARRLYTRLQAEEASLLALMENLLDHIREALSALAQPEVALYGGAAAARISSGLIEGKV